MTAQSMDVFALRDKVINDYKSFATSFTTIHAHDVRTKVEAIYNDGRYWPEPLIQINPNYEPAESIDELIAAELLDRGCSSIFRTGNGQSLRLHLHQKQAIAAAFEGESFVVTTGTGSSNQRVAQPTANPGILRGICQGNFAFVYVAAKHIPPPRAIAIASQRFPPKVVAPQQQSLSAAYCDGCMEPNRNSMPFPGNFWVLPTIAKTPPFRPDTLMISCT